ncbi:hypothetical protein [Salmonella phage NINP13076]|nr:hypothetical protein [Salmonella phage NINP13076]
MAAPTVPIEIWAYGDIVLPNTHELNKARPIDDLWNKGWDLGEKPTVEEFNYVLNMLTAWAKYITGEQIPGLDSRFLRVNQNLADLADKAAARTNLDVWSKTESDTRYVNISGDTMTGALSVPRLNFQPSESDYAYITTTNPAADTTFFDFVVGDNIGNAPGTSSIDSMRFRFIPSGGSIFTMMELNAISGTAALCRVTGNIIASGSISGASVTATTANFTNTTVSGTLNAPTIQSTTIRTGTLTATGNVQGFNVVATSSLTTPYARVNGQCNVNALVVNNNSATVGGRNVVRAINGATADGNGNVTLNLSGFVQQIRLGNRFSTGVSESTFYAGHVMTGWAFGNKKELRGASYYTAPLQYLINGQWVTVSNLN